MSRYDGLIIPRSYSEYINKTDAATLLQALQLSGVMDAAPTANSNHPVKSGGVYESLLKNEKYTSGERQIGVWIDNKPIYRKTINCGALKDAETLFVAHGITNLDKIVRLYGYTTNGTNKFILPYVSPERLEFQINLYVSGLYIIITPGNDRTAYTTTYVTIEYTKTN